MDASKILSAIMPDSAPEPATRVTIGVNWTLVSCDSGTGIVHTPAKTQQGCAPLAQAGTLIGRPLSALMDMVHDDNPMARAVGFAALNAYWNRRDSVGEVANGLDLVEDAGDRTVIIGRFPRLEKRLPGAAVIERNPGPQDHPETAAATLIPNAKFLVITASTLSNGSLAGLLSLRQEAFTVLVGPSTPLCSNLLDLGIDILAGFRVDDTDMAARTVMEGGAEKALRPSGTQLSLKRPQN